MAEGCRFHPSPRDGTCFVENLSCGEKVAEGRMRGLTGSGQPAHRQEPAAVSRCRLSITQFTLLASNGKNSGDGGSIMPSTLNISLTDELRAFIDQNSGDGSLYATPSEFVRSLLREKKLRMEAAAFREAILEGFQDVIEGRTVEYKGDVMALLKSKR
jgi:antitoxin ParD1/3/4